MHHKATGSPIILPHPKSKGKIQEKDNIPPTISQGPGETPSDFLDVNIIPLSRATGRY
jgi:hypothetical protein